MARKNRRAESRVQARHSNATAQGEFRAAPWMGALAFVASYSAALGGVSDGALDWRKIFDFDTIQPWLIYRDAFLSEAYAASGWGVNAQAPYYFPDRAFQWAMFALGAGVPVVLYLQPPLQVAAAAWGWATVCDSLYGKSAARRSAVWLLHALAFLLLAWRGEDLLGVHLLGVWHYGAWAAIPWLLWLSLRALSPDISHRQRWPALAGLAALLTATTSGDLIILNWFVFPAALCAVLTTRMSSLESRAALLAYLGTMAASALGFWLLHSPGVAFSAEVFARSVGRLADIMSRIGENNIPESLLWACFAAIAGWRALWLLPRLELFRGAKFREPHSGRGSVHALIGVPSGWRHRFAALFVPASSSASVLAVLVSGNLDLYPWTLPHLDRLTRHYLPFVYFPLFVGWALLPWKFERFPAPVRPSTFAAMMCALAVAAALPKAAATEREKLDPFASPFQKCFAENARRLGWRRGIGMPYHSLMLAANPDAGVEVVTGVWRNHRRGSPPPLEPWLYNSNWRWWRDAKGESEFQFVAVNLFQGRVFGRPPRGPQDAGCAPTIPEMLACFSSPEFIVDEAAARRAFGDPAEVIDCGGAGLLHYDPPLRFDPPDNQEDLGAWRVAP